MTATQKSHRKKPVITDIMVSDTYTGTYAEIARLAVEISKQDAAALRRIRDAITAGDDNAALALMREFFEFRDGSANESSKAKTQ